jgi:ribonuclease J
VNITIHRGTHQIGGCITEIKTENARIFIDMGSELPSKETKNNNELDIKGVTIGKPDCDAVLITHYHGDHIGMITKVLPGVPIYMGYVAKQVYSVIQGILKKKLGIGHPELMDSFITFNPGRSFRIKDITVTPYTVDHSAFDAYMFLIEAEGKRVLHTGDFRMHGARGAKMPKMFEKYVSNIDVLITEGTMLSRPVENVMTEHQLGLKAKDLMKKHMNVFVLCSSTNIDSLAEFYNAAIACKKPFIVCEDDFQLEILKIITDNSTSSFYDFNKYKVYTYADNLHNMMNKNGFCMMIRANAVSKKAVSIFPNNLLIYSMWDGYLYKNHPAYDKNKGEFIENAKAAGSIIELLHTSGHATAEDIKKVCEITKAKQVIPIHVEKPDAFMRLGIKSEIIMLQDGVKYKV